MWLALFHGSLQVVSEPPSNAKSYGTGALYNVALTRTSRIRFTDQGDESKAELGLLWN
jgi:hypothetical protein